MLPQPSPIYFCAQLSNEDLKGLGEAVTAILVPDVDRDTFEEDLKGLGEAVTAILVPDVDRDTFEARVISELKDPKFRLFYGMAKGPWRAPLFRQMGSSMWGYHNQHGCRRMVESFECLGKKLCSGKHVLQGRHPSLYGLRSKSPTQKI
eukprot:g14755.t1